MAGFPGLDDTSGRDVATPGTERRLTARRLSLAHALAAAAPASLLVTFLIGLTPDDEEFRWGILSSFLHVRALANGTLLSWTSTLGFGIPQPMVPNFNLYPLVPLLAVLSPVTWVRLLYAAQTIVAATGTWWLCRALGVAPIVRAVAVVTYLLATPTQNYALADFWPSHYVMWTSAPWLVWLAWRLLDPAEHNLLRVALLIGLTGGFVLATAHPGHVLVYWTVVAAVGAARYRAVLVRWRWIALAAAIALAMASPNLLQGAAQGAVFDPELGLVKFRDPLPLSRAGDIFFKPLSDLWKTDVVIGEARGIFFGGPFAALCLVGLFWLGRSHLDLALGAATSGMLLFTPLLPLTYVSRYHYRDPTLLCAIPLAALVADALLRSRRGRIPAIALLVAQCGAVTAVAFPFVRTVWAQQVTIARGATADTPVADALRSAMTAPGRVAYTPQVEFEVSERGGLPQGLGINALAYRGISLVNGSFKSVSTDVLWPDDRVFYGRIRVPAWLVASDRALDLLGVRYLIAKRGEVVAPGLHEVSALAAGRDVLVLYDNPDAGSGAFLIAAGPEELAELPVQSDCSNDRLLCRDLTPWAQLRTADAVGVLRRDNRIDLTIESGPAERLLVVAEMFRSTWSAASEDRALRVVSVGPGLIGVLVPAGTIAVRLEHRSVLFTSTTAVSWSATVAALGAWLLVSHRRRRRPPH